MSYGAVVQQSVLDRDDAFRNRRLGQRERARLARQQHTAAAAWVQRYMPECCHAMTGEPHPLVVDAAWALRDQLRRHAEELGLPDRRPTPDEVRWRAARLRPWLLDEIEQWRTTS